MKLRFLILIPGLILVGGTASAQTLEAVIDGLLRTHPQIEAARENLSAAEEGITRAFADFLPKVDFSGTYGYDNIDSPSRRSSNAENISTRSQSATLTMTENLFDGFKNYANNERAELKRDRAAIALEGNRQSIAFEGTTAYLVVLRDERLVELALSSEENIQTQLELEDERVRRGAGIAVDVLQAKSRLQISKERRVSFEGNFEDAKSRYQQVFGTPVDTEEMVMPTPPLERLPESLEEAVEIALDWHPSIDNSAALVDLARTERKTASADFYPDFDLVSEWSWENDFAGTLQERRDITVTLEVNWKLFSGFATEASVAEKAYLYRKSVDEEAFVTRKVIEEVRLAWQGLETVRERVRLLQNAVNIAAEVFDSRRKLREAGRETVINVLDAESEVFNARINFVSAQHDARAAVYRVLLAVGLLTPEYLTARMQMGGQPTVAPQSAEAETPQTASVTPVQAPATEETSAEASEEAVSAALPAEASPEGATPGPSDADDAAAEEQAAVSPAPLSDAAADPEQPLAAETATMTPVEAPAALEATEAPAQDLAATAEPEPLTAPEASEAPAQDLAAASKAEPSTSAETLSPIAPEAAEAPTQELAAIAEPELPTTPEASEAPVQEAITTAELEPPAATENLAEEAEMRAPGLAATTEDEAPALAPIEAETALRQNLEWYWPYD